MNSSDVELKSFSREFLPLAFRGFVKTGYCFLRIVVENNKPLFFCCQLPNYTGISVTNAVEEIFSTAITLLLEAKNEKGEAVASYRIGPSIFQKVFRSKAAINRAQRAHIADFIKARAIWIEHYPPGSGLAEQGSFARVVFTQSGEPVWHYAPQAILAAQLGIDERLISADYTALSGWQDAVR